MILTRTQVTELSGYRKPSCQIKWLKRQGLRFFVGAHEPAGAPFLGRVPVRYGLGKGALNLGPAASGDVAGLHQRNAGIEHLRELPGGHDPRHDAGITRSRSGE